MYEGKITGFRDPDVPAAELGRLMAGGADAASSRWAQRQPLAPPPGAACRAGRGRQPHHGHGTPGTAARPPAAGGLVTRHRRRSPRDAAHRRGARGAPGVSGVRSGQSSRNLFSKETPSRSRCSPWCTALVLGGLLAAFTNTTVLHAPDGRGDASRRPGTSPRAPTSRCSRGRCSTRTPSRRCSSRRRYPPRSTTGTCRPCSARCRRRRSGDAADPHRAGRGAAVPGGPVQHRRAGPVHRRRHHGRLARLRPVTLPFFVHVVVCVLGGFVGGAAIGWLAGEIKARTGAHEVIVTIMLNYVMAVPAGLPAVVPSRCCRRPGHPTRSRRPIASNAHLPLLAGTNLRINVGFLIAHRLRVRRLVAAEPDHHRVRVPQRRRQPVGRAGGRA